MVQGFPVYEQNEMKTNIKQFLFVGPFGNWRVGPDTSTYKRSGLKNTKRSATPPRTGWQYHNQWRWVKDDAIRTTLKAIGKENERIATPC